MWTLSSDRGEAEASRGYTAVMRSVGDELRQARLAEQSRRSFAELLQQAFALGDADADLFAANRAISVDDARRILRRQRQHGRRPSCARELT